MPSPQIKEPVAPVLRCAVSVRKSLGDPDFIVSMIDGKRYRALRRHLTTHGLSPKGYRERYKARADFAMVAPVYPEQRRAVARKIGLGRKPAERAPTQAARSAQFSGEEPAEARRKRPRKTNRFR